MRSIWNGSISFGLVNVPVKMFTATQDKDIRFRTLHKVCHTPIQYRKFCPNCEQEVTADDLVKAYEYEKGRFVIIEDEDLDALAIAQTRSIDIIDFVNLAEIDPIYFYKSYYLGVGDTGQKAYWLLRKAMEETGKIAIAKVVLRDKQHLAALRVLPECLSLALMFYPDEIRSAEVLLPEREVALQESEMQMATQLIESLTSPFQPEKYTDEYRAELLKVIEAKIAGQAVAVPKPQQPGKVIDLMEALQASLALVEQNKQQPARHTGA
ncbi:MAG TPA: Ku protein [Firmicutes bacterium]|nr:Ku protein [Bacillota bacterium]